MNCIWILLVSGSLLTVVLKKRSKLRPKNILSDTLQSKLFLLSAILQNTSFFFCSFFYAGSGVGGKIQIIQSLLLTDKISINSRYRLKKVRTNIAVDSIAYSATAWRPIQKQTILTAPRDRSTESPRTTRNKITSRGPIVLHFVPLSPPRDSVQYKSLPSPVYRSWQKKEAS